MRPTRLFLLTIALMAMLSSCSSNRLSIEVDGRSRTYYLQVPSDYDAAQSYPLVLALHQFSDTASGMRRLTGFDSIAERERFIVCYPQGRFRVWNAGQRENGSDVQFLTALVEELAAKYSIDRDRVYATGISAGGMMAHYLACQTDLLAAIATVSGTPVRSVLEDCARDSPLPVMIIHGEEDAIVPYAGGDVSTGAGNMSFLSAAELAETWSGINRCEDSAPLTETLPPLIEEDSSRVTRTTYSCDAGAEVIFLSVGDAGHTWPGRDNWYPAFIVGPTSMQLDASEAVWEFFSRQERERDAN